MSNSSSLALAALAAFSSSQALAQATHEAALPVVTVTATRFNEDADKLPLGVSVITAKDLQTSGVSTVNEAVMKLLGVPGRQDFYGGGNYSLDLRGFGETANSNQVIVVDGVRMNDADLSVPFLASLPIDTIERIEVLRGSGSVLYGEGATGGVIAITTKAGSWAVRRPGGQVFGALGSHRLREVRTSATLVAGEFSFDVSASRRATDNHRDNFQSRTEGLSLGGQWRHDWLRVGLNYAHDDLDGGLPGSLSAAQYADNPRQTATPQAHADIRNDRLTGFLQACVGEWEVLLDAGRRHKELRLYNGYQYDYDVDSENYSVRAKHQTGNDNLRNAFVIGADAGHWVREVLGTYGSLATQSNQAVFIKDDVTLGTGTRLSLGWRTEQLDKDNSYAVSTLNTRHKAWELGLVQPLSAALSVYGRYGSSFRLPNVDEFGATLVGVTLMPQTSRDVEVGGRWSAGPTRAELRVYRNQLTNEIGYDPTAGAFGANINFDPTQRRGLELEVAQQVTTTLQVRANGALRKATFRSGTYAGKDVPLTPRRSVALRADWKLLPDQQLSAVVNMVDAQHPDYANSCRMTGYVTADARYAYQWGSAQWALGLNNLADRKYYTQAYRCSAGVTQAIYPEAGRTLTASVRMQF